VLLARRSLLQPALPGAQRRGQAMVARLPPPRNNPATNSATRSGRRAQLQGAEFDATLTIAKLQAAREAPA
jgi:hypothetical protein